MQAIDDSVNSGRYVSAAELRALVSGYLQDAMAVEVTSRSDDGLTILIPSNARLSAAVAAHLQSEGDTRPGSAEFLRKLNAGTRVAATFEGEMAFRRPLLELLNLRHPLVRMAARHYRDRLDGQDGPYPFACLTVESTRLDEAAGPWPPVGEYEFMLVLLSVSGAQHQVRLLPIVFDKQSGRRVSEAEDRLLRLVQGLAEDGDAEEVTLDERMSLESRAMIVAASIADLVEAEAIDRNVAQIAVQRATLERTFGHRIDKRRALLQHATDERIRRMRAGEIANLEADLARRIDELESRRAVAVTSAPVGAGRLRIVEVATPIRPTLAEPETETAVEVIAPYEEPPTVFGRHQG